ncbi:hypothetical protein D9M73_157310 [compost metagenome]
MDLSHYAHASKLKDLKHSQNRHRSEYKHHIQQNQYPRQMSGNRHQCSQMNYEYHERLLLSYSLKYQQHVIF